MRYRRKVLKDITSVFNLLDFPVYKPGNQNIYSLNEEQSEVFAKIFARMFDQQHSDNPYKENMLRIYLLEIIFETLGLKPSGSYTRTNNTSE